MDVTILVNVAAGQYTNHLKDLQMPDAGGLRDMSHRTMDGLFIYNNLVTMNPGAPYGAVQTQKDGLDNVWIYDNVLRSVDGDGTDLRAIGVNGKTSNVVLRNNVCDPGMYCELTSKDVLYSGNTDLSGVPMFDRYHKRTLDACRIPDRPDGGSK